MSVKNNAPAVEKARRAFLRRDYKKMRVAGHDEAFARYWAGSISASVMADYATGNVKEIRS